MRPSARFGLLLGVSGLVFLAAAERSAHSQAAHPKIDQTKVCLECHDDLGAELSAAVEHPPAASGECTACHNPHVARNARLLLDRPAILCAGCHQDLAAELTLPVVHQPVADGRCVDCHRAHGGDHEKLLVRPPAELCGTCHGEIELWRQKPVQHSPFRRNRCRDCHAPHAGENAALALKPGGGVCVSCHPVSAEFRRDHQGYPVEAVGCAQCHDPHASAREGLFRERLHLPFESGDCSTCHVAPTEEKPFALTAPVEQLCGDCHEDAVEEGQNTPFPHISAAGGECSSCHNPHTADGESFLKQPQPALCLECHDPGGSASGEEGRFTTHGDLECSTCHGAHGSGQPVLLHQDAVSLCGECHSHQHAVTHPMGEEVLDPRNGHPMSCTSCHGLHEAPSPKYLHRSGDRDLCVGCHQQKGRTAP